MNNKKRQFQQGISRFNALNKRSDTTSSTSEAIQRLQQVKRYNKPKAILFISRAYPPTIGGIENQNYGIARALSKITTVKIIANKRGKKFLPFFLIQATGQALFSVWKYDVVLIGDGVLSPLALFLKFFYPKKKFVSIIHGLDITYAHKKSLMGKIYRLINIPSLKKMNKLIMVGNHTIKEAVAVGIPKNKCVFIPNGFNLQEICQKHSRAELEKLLKMDLSGKKVILRVGRFVRHKGLEWFISNVMPHLPENCILVGAGGRNKKTVGDGDIYPNCQKAIQKNNLQDRVKLLTNIPQSDMNILFNTVDLFISPNIEIAGSMEGFGINAIEGSACQKVVIASNLQGLKDAVIDGKNGFLVEPENTEQWIKKIKAILEADDFRRAFGKRAQQYTVKNFSWSTIAEKYLQELQKL